jgi:hypothetical protein
MSSALKKGSKLRLPAPRSQLTALQAGDCCLNTATSDGEDSPYYPCMILGNGNCGIYQIGGGAALLLIARMLIVEILSTTLIFVNRDSLTLFKPFVQPFSSIPQISSMVSTDQESPADPCVIVGAACRVPGATNTHELWNMLENQKDLQRKMPADRYNAEAFYHPEGTNKGTVR